MLTFLSPQFLTGLFVPVGQDFDLSDALGGEYS